MTYEQITYTQALSTEDISGYELVYLSYAPEDYDYDHYDHKLPSEKIQTTIAEMIEIDHKAKQVIIK